MIRYKFLAILICASLFACNYAKEEKAVVQSVRPVKYTVLGQTNLVGEHSYTGLAKAQKEANLSFKVGGTINSIPVKVGDNVRKGQILAILDATDYRISYSQSLANVQNSKAQIENAMAQLESAKANYITAQSNYERFEKLYETNSISLSDFEKAKASYLGAEASYKAAQTQVEASQAGNASSESMAKAASNQVNYTKLTAPFAGIITKINVEPNEVAGQGTPVLEINSVTIPDVEVGIPENTISEIKENQKVLVEFNSITNQKYSGFVHEIGYSSVGSTYPVTIRLKGMDKRIRPGMPASATFSTQNVDSIKTVLLVPPSAVGEDSQGNFVYKINSAGEGYVCKKQTVKVGKLSDEGFQVLTGLKAGDMVSTAGLNVLRDGMQVSLYQKNNHKG